MYNAAEFRKLLTVSFISQAGSHFLTLALAAHVMFSSGSPIQAAMIFVVSFFPSILVSTPIGTWVDRGVSRWLFARNELISILTTLLCGLCIYYHLPLSVLCLVLGIRSVLMFISRATASKWIKLISPPEFQTKRIKLFSLSFFLSTAISGVLASVVLAKGSVLTVVGLDALSYLVGVAIIMTFRPHPAAGQLPSSAIGAPPIKMWDTIRCVAQMPTVRTSFLLVCFSQALFQGVYSVLVSFLPIRQYGIAMAGVGYFQIAASIGITAGFALNWLNPKALNEKRQEFPVNALLVAAFTISAILVCSYNQTLAFGLGSFVLLNLGYEVIWLHHSAEFFRASPKNDAARYQFTISACASFLMAVATLAYSAAIQYLGLLQGVLTVLAIGILSAIVLTTVGTRAVRMGVTDGAVS